ncbi:MAG: DUF4011 domain-containing protein, partial [Planctomycetota bacterium]
TGEEGREKLLREEMASKRLHADLPEEELNRRLLNTYRAARLGMEETGANSLYLALGFLSWSEGGKLGENPLAPILMIPVQLTRESARGKFELHQGEDEPRINVTLLEMLSQEHGIQIPELDPLPQDDHGLDVPEIFLRFREAVKDLDRWDVLETVQLGLFSFTKFLMWRDLTDRAKDLLQNRIVYHLVHRPEEAFDDDATFPEPATLDDTHSPLKTFCPLSADSSQLAAVFAAAEGKCFVLEGPPGTGKSQTITNLIAHCLYLGKSVLFISEKMAALNVVSSRLDRIGLGRFCLELHSNKAKKREVIAQLRDALQRTERRSWEAWEREGKRLEKIRNELNAYVRALHRVRSTGESAYQATAKLIGLREAPYVRFDFPSPDGFDAEKIETLRDLTASLATAGKACGDLTKHPWRAVGAMEWSPRWQEDALAKIAEVRRTLGLLEKGERELAKIFSFADEGCSWNRLQVFNALAALFLDPPAPSEALLLEPDWKAVQASVASWIAHGRRRNELRNDLYGRYTEAILQLPLDDLTKRLTRAEKSWWPLSWLRRRGVQMELQGVSKSGEKPAPTALAGDLKRARELAGEEKALSDAAPEARHLLGRHWKEGEADWDALEVLSDWAGKVRSLASGVAGQDFEKGATLKRAWVRLAVEGHELLRNEGSIGKKLDAFRKVLKGFETARQTIDYLLDLEAETAWGPNEAMDAFGRAKTSLSDWEGNAGKLREWCAWRRARKQALEASLQPIVEAFEAGKIAPGDLPRAFTHSFYRWWLDALVDSDALLKDFFSPEHERRIQQFHKVDRKVLDLTRDIIEAKLALKVPAPSGGDVKGSEMGILKREIQKKIRHLPIRVLFQKIPNLLPRLKPCLLMSPMSVAQFLEPGHSPFDLVVFDEASQIPVWDAVGAIARGSQAVIVGDPKQLPPTSFFQRGDVEEEVEDEEIVEDLESILDDCIASGIPWIHLDWHYRSRHESLIAFSNAHYYENRLFTFPSPRKDGLGVSWHPVPDGVYDKGRSRTNRKEADAIAREILRRLRDPFLSKFSIGVVTFNQAQQTLVEDLLEKARREDPGIERFFGDESPEPVFVK